MNAKKFRPADVARAIASVCSIDEELGERFGDVCDELLKLREPGWVRAEVPRLAESIIDEVRERGVPSGLAVLERVLAEVREGRDATGGGVTPDAPNVVDTGSGVEAVRDPRRTSLGARCLAEWRKSSVVRNSTLFGIAGLMAVGASVIVGQALQWNSVEAARRTWQVEYGPIDDLRRARAIEERVGDTHVVKKVQWSAATSVMQLEGNSEFLLVWQSPGDAHMPYLCSYEAATTTLGRDTAIGERSFPDITLRCKPLDGCISYVDLVPGKPRWRWNGSVYDGQPRAATKDDDVYRGGTPDEPEKGQPRWKDGGEVVPVERDIPTGLFDRWFKRDGAGGYLSETCWKRK